MYEFKIGNVVKTMEKDEFEKKVNGAIDLSIENGSFYEEIEVNDILKNVLEITAPKGKMILAANEAKGYVYQQILVKGNEMKSNPHKNR